MNLYYVFYFLKGSFLKSNKCSLWENLWKIIEF